MLIFWAVLGGFVLDAIFADPAWLPHPVVLMGRWPNCTRRWGWPCKCSGAGRPLRPKALSRKA